MSRNKAYCCSDCERQAIESLQGGCLYCGGLLPTSKPRMHQGCPVASRALEFPRTYGYGQDDTNLGYHHKAPKGYFYPKTIGNLPIGYASPIVVPGHLH